MGTWKEIVFTTFENNNYKIELNCNIELFFSVKLVIRVCGIDTCLTVHRRNTAIQRVKQERPLMQSIKGRRLIVYACVICWTTRNNQGQSPLSL